jgi:hypothetical protein
MNPPLSRYEDAENKDNWQPQKLNEIFLTDFQYFTILHTTMYCIVLIKTYIFVL